MKSIKLTANKIIIIIFVLFCIVILTAKLPCSQAGLSFELDNAEQWAEAGISVKGSAGSSFEQTVLTDGGKICFSVIDCYPVESISIYIASENADVASATMTSRAYSVYHWSGDELHDSIIYHNENDKTSFDVSNDFIDKYNQIYEYDWRLRSDILIPALVIFIYFEAAYLLIRRMGLGFRGVLAAVIFFVCGFGIYIILSNTTNQTYLKVDNYIEHARVSSVITANEEYRQEFYTGDEKVCGLSVTLAKYGAELSGDYIFKLYNADSDTEVLERRIAGEDIIDGAGHEILFGDTLKKNQKYYFYIVASDAYNESEDTLVIWLSESDQYKEGALYKDNKELDADMDFGLIARGPENVKWMLAFMGIFIFAVIIALIYNWTGLTRNAAKLLIYILVFVLCILKISYYYQYFNLGILDETAQISYIAYLDEVDGSIIPDYENMTLLMPYNKTPVQDPANLYSFEQTKGVYKGMFTGTVNYMGHPPLYYSLMRLTGSITSDDNYVYVNLLPLRLFNIVLVLASIAIMFYIGFTRIKRKPVYHMLFAMLCTSVPLVCYEASMVNNDNLTLLTVVIFILGALRASENKLDYATYFMLAAGISLSLLTKLTAGLMVLLTAVIYLIWTSIRQRSLNLIFNKCFVSTIPVYILAAAYYIIMFVKYGTFQPALSSYAYEQYLNYPSVYVPVQERAIVEFWDIMKRFYNAFIMQWKQGAMWETKYNGWTNLGTALLWVFPVIYVITNKKKKRKERLYISAAAAIVITLVMQLIRFFRDFQYVSGHGSAQSRYYLCMILILALIAVDYLGKCFDNNRRLVRFYTNNHKVITITREKAGVVLALVYCIVLFYADIVYNLMSSVRFKF